MSSGQNLGVPYSQAVPLTFMLFCLDAVFQNMLLVPWVKIPEVFCFVLGRKVLKLFLITTEALTVKMYILITTFSR